MESPSFGSREMCDGEILDELTTSRGELKVRSVSFREERHGQVTTIHFFSLFEA